MKILLLILLIIIILYFVVRNYSPFGSLISISNYPSPLPGPVTSSQVSSWTTINDILNDNSILVYSSTNTVKPTLEFYNMNLDMTRSTTKRSPNPVPPNQFDQTIVNYYLNGDIYASSFMENASRIPIPSTIINVSLYNTTTGSLAMTQKYNEIDYHTLSWDNVKTLSSVSLKTAPTVPITDPSIIKKIKASVLYSLINFYYNPGSGGGYTGLVKDFSTNYPVGVTTSVINTPDASTMGITFTPASKHAVWVYLLARAQWINTAIQGL
jgi:hypothetical protein